MRTSIGSTGDNLCQRGAPMLVRAAKPQNLDAQKLNVSGNRSSVVGAANERCFQIQKNVRRATEKAPQRNLVDTQRATPGTPKQDANVCKST